MSIYLKTQHSCYKFTALRSCHRFLLKNLRHQSLYCHPLIFSYDFIARMGLNCQLTSSCICERRRMSPCGSSMRPERMMGHMPASASTSSMARCVTVSRPKALAMSESLWEESMGSAIRERARLSTQRSLTSRPPGAFSTKPRSKLALWAMTDKIGRAHV